MAVDYYRQSLFGDATFADLMRRDGPLLLINTSDLGQGVRFSFVQEYFDLLCSDLSNFPLAGAVTASSAVPVLFDAVVVENFAGCGKGVPDWLVQARARQPSDPNLRMVTAEDLSYRDHAGHRPHHDRGDLLRQQGHPAHPGSEELWRAQDWRHSPRFSGLPGAE